MTSSQKQYLNPALGAFFTLLQATPAEVERVEGIPYKTTYHLLYCQRNPDGVTLVRLVRALRAIAAERTAKGLPSLPPEAITCEALCPVAARPLPFNSKVSTPSGTKQRHGSAA